MENNQEQPKEMRTISTETVNATLQYLSGRPYIEVFKIVQVLIALPVVPGTSPVVVDPPPPAAPTEAK